MDFIDQEAECSSDCSDSSSLNNEWAEDMESFIDDEEYESDDGVHTFANVVKPIDEEDPQPRLYDRNSVDGRVIDNFKWASIELKNLGRAFSLLKLKKSLTYFFWRLYLIFII